MIRHVENFIKELFPNIYNLQIVENDEKYICEYSYYVSNSFGNPISRNCKINVAMVDGFLKIVE